MTTTTDTLNTTLRCCACGIAFIMPEGLREQRLSDGAPFYCPNGHGNFFQDTPQSQLAHMTLERDQWEKEAQRLLEEVDRLRDENLKLRRSRSIFGRRSARTP